MPFRATSEEPTPAVSPTPSIACSWPPAAQNVSLHPGEVHVWCAAQGSFPQQLANFCSAISTAELDRAGRFRFPAHRDRYIARHGILRLILGRYLDQDPGRLEFERGKFGKPSLKNNPALHFNDSHSGELALFAFTTLCPIGVDIECLRPIPEFENIAAQYFCSREIELMRLLPPEKRMAAFYSCWTGKEAYLKATGEGISEGLDKVEVILDENLCAIALHVPGDPHANWSLQSFSPAPGYVGAVVLQGYIPPVSHWQFPSQGA